MFLYGDGPWGSRCFVRRLMDRAGRRMMAGMVHRVLHVIHESAPEDAALLLAQLIEAMPDERVDQHVLIVGRATPAVASLPRERVTRVGSRMLLPVGAGPDVRRVVNRRRPTVVIAWDMVSAAALGAAQVQRSPVIVTIADPRDAESAARWHRSLAGAAQVVMVCLSQRVQRRLVEFGVPLESTTIIRPGVDFGAIREARESVTRKTLGLPESGRVFVTASPPTRAGGQFEALWAVAILRLIWPDTRLLIPGISREQRRLKRLVRAIGGGEIFAFVDERYSRAELLAVADGLLVPAKDDVASGWIAWAMAAGVPVIGVAQYSVAELIADRHNGYLCKTAAPHEFAIRIRTALENTELVRQCCATARSTAYDVFRMRGCTQEFLKVITNVAEGRPVFADVQDLAIV